MTPRVVVVGAGGFIGSTLTAGLTGPVLPLSRRDLDLVDPATIRLRLRPGDVVVNAAGYADATDQTLGGRERFQRSNVDAVRSLANASADTGVAHLVHISSVAAMGRWQGKGITESHLREPTTAYAQSKREAEVILAGYRDRLPVTILRPTSVFGEGRPLAAALCRVASRSVIPVPGGGRALIPFTHVGNLVEAVRLTIGNERCFGDTYIVGDERSYTLREILDALAAALGSHPRFVSIPTLVARMGVATSAMAGRLRNRRGAVDPGRLETLTTSVEYSIAAFHNATGYIPPVSLADAAARLAAWHLDSAS